MRWCQTHLLLLILCSWCCIPNKWRRSCGFHVTLKCCLASQHVKPQLNTNPLCQRWLESTKRCSLLLVSAMADDWTLKRRLFILMSFRNPLWCIFLKAEVHGHLHADIIFKKNWITIHHVLRLHVFALAFYFLEKQMRALQKVQYVKIPHPMVTHHCLGAV